MGCSPAPTRQMGGTIVQALSSSRMSLASMKLRWSRQPWCRTRADFVAPTKNAILATKLLTSSAIRISTFARLTFKDVGQIGVPGSPRLPSSLENVASIPDARIAKTLPDANRVRAFATIVEDIGVTDGGGEA